MEIVNDIMKLIRYSQSLCILKNQTETISKLFIDIKQSINELKKIQEQYEYWNDLKDPQPDIAKEQEEARQY